MCCFSDIILGTIHPLTSTWVTSTCAHCIATTSSTSQHLKFYSLLFLSTTSNNWAHMQHSTCWAIHFTNSHSHYDIRIRNSCMHHWPAKCLLLATYFVCINGCLNCSPLCHMIMLHSSFVSFFQSVIMSMLFFLFNKSNHSYKLSLLKAIKKYI